MKMLRIFSVIFFFSVILAGCSREKYTVTFDVGEGSGTAPAPIVVPSGKFFTLPGQGDMVAPPGTFFDTWTTDGSVIVSKRFFITSDRTLVARWVKMPVPITYKVDDGTSVQTITKILYEKIDEYEYDSGKISMPNVPYKNGYHFAGWFADAAWTIPITDSTMITDGITLYAKWLPIASTIPFNTENALYGFDRKSIQELFYSYDRIEPIGWSPNGLFAYRIDGSNSVIPAFGYLLNIFNAVTDEYIEHRRIWTDFPDEGFEFPNEEVLAGVRQEWQEVLKKYEISGNVGSPIAEISTRGYFGFEDGGAGCLNNTDFFCWFEYELVDDNEGWESEVINWKLIIEVNNKRKVVSSGSELSYMLWGKKLQGYFQSPYENRIIIMVVDVGHGFEGETAIDTVLYGCHLGVGFE